MMESELLQRALATVKDLSNFLDQAYDQHNHDTDLAGGILLSSAKMFVRAIEESIIAILIHLNQGK